MPWRKAAHPAEFESFRAARLSEADEARKRA
jgi:hypothetical protein